METINRKGHRDDLNQRRTSNSHLGLKQSNAQRYQRPSSSLGRSINNTQRYSQSKPSRFGKISSYKSAGFGQGKRKINPLLLGILAAILVLVGAGVACAIINAPITIILNDQVVKVAKDSTLGTLYEEMDQQPPAGDLLAIDGSLLQEGGGLLYTASVNEQTADDLAMPLVGGDYIMISRGANMTEDYDEQVQIVPVNPEVLEVGIGPLHRMKPAVDGRIITRVGATSGKTVQEQIPGAQKTYFRYYPNVGNDKVIALTFDDGPWGQSTQATLDLLKKYDIQATFFVIGENIDEKSDGPSLIMQEIAAGHQVCTHTYNHARYGGESRDVSLLAPADQVAEFRNGEEAIARVTGQPASKVVRTPGGIFPLELWQNVEEYVEVEVGWTIDTGDWQQAGVEGIVQELKKSQPGSIILCHDGGGDRSQTREALDEVIPYLQQLGYRFITIDEMLEYPQSIDTPL